MWIYWPRSVCNFRIKKRFVNQTSLYRREQVAYRFHFILLKGLLPTSDTITAKVIKFTQSSPIQISFTVTFDLKQLLVCFLHFVQPEALDLHFSSFTTWGIYSAIAKQAGI